MTEKGKQRVRAWVLVAPFLLTLLLWTISIRWPVLVPDSLVTTNGLQGQLWAGRFIVTAVTNRSPGMRYQVEVVVPGRMSIHWMEWRDPVAARKRMAQVRRYSGTITTAPRITTPEVSWRNGFGFHWFVADGSPSEVVYYVVIPLWPIPAPTTIWWIYRWHRDRRRRLLGQCRRCGYDLRATPERCPECGLQV